MDPALVVRQGQPLLDDSLAVGGLADQDSPAASLESSGKDLGRGRRAAVHQHDDFDRGVESEGRLVRFGVGRDFRKRPVLVHLVQKSPRLYELAGDVDRGRQVAAAVAAKVDDDRVPALFQRVGQGQSELRVGRAVEAVQLDVLDLAAGQNATFDFDAVVDLAHDRDVGARRATEDRQRDRGVALALDEGDYLVDVQAVERDSVHGRDDVAGLEFGVLGRRAGDGPDYGQLAAAPGELAIGCPAVQRRLQLDRDADPLRLAAHVQQRVAEVLGALVVGVGVVQGAHHALDGALDQLVRAGLRRAGVLLADQLVDVPERGPARLLIGRGAGRGGHPGAEGEAAHEQGRGGQEEDRDQAQARGVEGPRLAGRLICRLGPRSLGPRGLGKWRVLANGHGGTSRWMAGPEIRISGRDSYEPTRRSPAPRFRSRSGARSGPRSGRPWRWPGPVAPRRSRPGPRPGGPGQATTDLW